jgi:hypothetical protein
LGLVEVLRSFAVQIDGPRPLLGDRLRAGAPIHRSQERCDKKRSQEKEADSSKNHSHPFQSLKITVQTMPVYQGGKKLSRGRND